MDLKEFQSKMPCGFEYIAVDIVGFCNAKCKYCPSGGDLTNKGKYISVDMFERILDKLVQYKMLSNKTSFHVYSLGEPCLHPEINNILRVLKKYNIHTTISTNASFIPKFEMDALECVDRFLISMPGFSQESYNRIHGFNFNKICDNVLKLRKQVKELSDDRIKFDMSYHIYQFNEAEMVPAKKFCDENDIRFAPNYAVMFDKDRCLDYVTGKMSYDELKDISKEIFLGVLDQQIKDAPMDYCDFQNSFLNINVDGNVRLCGGFTREAESKLILGNILTDNIDDIIYRKWHHPRCDKCIKAGLTLAKSYECKVYPNGYYTIMKENEFLLSHIGDKNVNEKLEIMKLAREYEESGYDDNIRLKLCELVQKADMSEMELKAIVLEYTRFGKGTYAKLR